jgi:hypothetical protein
MKKLNRILALIALFSLGFAKSQDIKNWRTLKPEQRKELINKMKPEERVQLLKQFRENMMVEELEVPEDKKSDFKNLYNEYQESQRQIKEKFKSSQNYEGLNDSEAKKELERSFELGQQLLDNRKRYSEKFQKVVKPQQILEMFQNEGMMRSKIMNRKNEDQNRGGQMNRSRGTQDRGRQLQETNGRTPLRNNNNGFRTQSRRP